MLPREHSVLPWRQSLLLAGVFVGLRSATVTVRLSRVALSCVLDVT